MSAIVLLVFAVLGAAVLEVGTWYIHRRHLQVATDAAALAGGQLFSECFANSANAFTLMKGAADQYGGFNGSSTNVEFNGTGSTGGTVSRDYNRLAYPAGTHPPDTDFTDNVDPCAGPPAGGLFDVKATETGIPSLFNFFGYSPLATVNAHARVQIFQENEATGLLPIAVPDPEFNFAFASFIDESKGSPIPNCVINGTADSALAANCEIELFKTGVKDAQGNIIWAPKTGVSISVPVSTKDIGVRFRLVGTTSPTTPCGQLYTECYTDPSGNLGLVYIRGWDPNAAAPDAHNVWLTSGNCSPDAYFTTADCSAGIQAEVDLGSLPLTGTDVTVKVTADAGAGPVSLQQGTQVGTTGSVFEWFANSGLAVTGVGGHPVTLSYAWEKTSGTWQGNTCTTKNTNPCKRSGALETGDHVVQRAFEGSIANAGPIQLAQVYEPGKTTFGSNSFVRGSKPALGVALATSGTLQTQAAATAPVISLRVVGGSQNQTVDCDPAISNFDTELQKGCAPTYITNPSLDCSAYNNVPALWGSPQPWPCVAVQTGASVGQLEDGLSERIFGTKKPPSTCPAFPQKGSLQWPYVQANDPNSTRVFDLIITPFGTFSGSGNAVVPVLTFGAFYVMGWDNDPCDPQANTIPSGDVVGHFVSYQNSGAKPSQTQCYFSNPDQIIPCVAILTR